MPHEKTKSDNDTSTARSAKAQKAEEVQNAGTAKAGGYLAESMVPEGGLPPPTQKAHGKPMPAASRADADGTTEEGTSSATAGKAEKQAAAQNAALTKEQHGRGHRKAE